MMWVPHSSFPNCCYVHPVIFFSHFRYYAFQILRFPFDYFKINLLFLRFLIYSLWTFLQPLEHNYNSFLKILLPNFLPLLTLDSIMTFWKELVLFLCLSRHVTWLYLDPRLWRPHCGPHKYMVHGPAWGFAECLCRFLVPPFSASYWNWFLYFPTVAVALNSVLWFFKSGGCLSFICPPNLWAANFPQGLLDWWGCLDLLPYFCCCPMTYIVH